MSLLLGGVAVFAALGGMATFVEVPRVVAGPMVLAMVLAWFVGFCGMIGYLRWAFRSAVSEERNSRSIDRKE